MPRPATAECAEWTNSRNLPAGTTLTSETVDKNRVMMISGQFKKVFDPPPSHFFYKTLFLSSPHSPSHSFPHEQEQDYSTDTHTHSHKMISLQARSLALLALLLCFFTSAVTAQEGTPKVGLDVPDYDSPGGK